MVTDLREVGIVEIYAPVMRIETATVPAALATRLLEATGSQKIAYFGIEDVDDKPWVFAYHNLATAGLTAKPLVAVLITVAEIARRGAPGEPRGGVCPSGDRSDIWEPLPFP